MILHPVFRAAPFEQTHSAFLRVFTRVIDGSARPLEYLRASFSYALNVLSTLENQLQLY